MAATSEPFGWWIEREAEARRRQAEARAHELAVRMSAAYPDEARRRWLYTQAYAWAMRHQGYGVQEG